MPIDYRALKSFPFEDIEQVYGPKDTILYALGIGLGSDPLDREQLQYVYEKDLRAFPTMGVVLALAKPWLHRPESGVTWNRMLHGEQGLVIHRPIPPQGTLVGQTTMEEIVDKGPGRGALLYMSRTVRDKSTGEKVFTSKQTLFCRADGGFGGPVTQARPVHELPPGEPSWSVELATVPQAALIYRLSGDSNPLHADLEAATAAGFPSPILHGLCSFGIAGHALLRMVGGYRSDALRAIQARFTAPVFPGETIRTDIWEQPGGQFGFRCRVTQRDIVVIDNGLAELS